jgi:hypothetical protein
VPSNTLKTVPKISVKIWRPIIEKLDAKIAAACVRRDAYLIKLLEVEVDYLDDEVSIPNSQVSYDWVFDRLNQFDRKLVSLALPLELTAHLNEVCSRKRIVRDAFFNRLFLLLAVSQKDFDMLLFGNAGDKWRTDVRTESKNDGRFFRNEFSTLQPVIDPFWAVRSGLKKFANDAEMQDFVEPESGRTIRVKRNLGGAIAPADSLYTTIFQYKVRENDLRGLSCYMPDWSIPGHVAELEHVAKLAKASGLS